MSVALTGPLPPSATGHRCTGPQPAGTLSLAGRWRARAPRLSTFTYSYFPAGLAPGTATGTGHLSSSRACKSHGDQPGDRSPLTESSHSPTRSLVQKHGRYRCRAYTYKYTTRDHGQRTCSVPCTRAPRYRSARVLYIYVRWTVAPCTGRVRARACACACGGE